MANSYVSVDHVSDELKTDGIVESYQMIDVEEEGRIVKKRLNFVIWPNIPSPAFHEEWSEDLVFDSIFTPKADEDEEIENDEIVEAVKELYPDVYNDVVNSLQEDEEEFVEFEDENGSENEEYEFEQQAE